MALDLMHVDTITDGEPAGMVTTGGSGSILHALVAYREYARQTRGVTRPNFVKPETGHAAFRKGVPPVRDRAALGTGRPGDHDGRRRCGRRPRRRRHQRAVLPAA